MSESQAFVLSYTHTTQSAVQGQLLIASKLRSSDGVRDTLQSCCCEENNIVVDKREYN